MIFLVLKYRWTIILSPPNGPRRLYETIFGQESITRSVYLVLGWWVNRFASDQIESRGIDFCSPHAPDLLDRSSLQQGALVSSLQRRAERQNGKFKKIMKTRNILIFIR